MTSSPALARCPGTLSWAWARARWTDAAVRMGQVAGWLSRRLGLGAGAVIGGRVTLLLDRSALHRLAVGRRVVIVSGTNGKTTTAHMIAAALGTVGPVVHNATGANMADGVVAALAQRRSAPLAVLEVDELHVGRVADATDPAVVVLLNLTRDQLDRGHEVRTVAHSLGRALVRHPGSLVVANADDPMVVAAVGTAPSVVGVAAGADWLADSASCPACGRGLCVVDGDWRCACGFGRPRPAWGVDEHGVRNPGGSVPLWLGLPGRVNHGNAAMALAAVGALGVPLERAGAALAGLGAVAGRYAVVRHGSQRLHLLLAKNPAGWAVTLPMLDRATALLLVVNARPPDGRDTSWLWDVPFERLPVLPTVASGDRAADLGLRLAYAERDARTEPDPVAALRLLPDGDVHVVANYTAFHGLVRRLGDRRTS